MRSLIITRGLPASGKTTLAREWVAADVRNRVRINRDDLRTMLTNYEYVGGREGTEKTVRSMRDKLVGAALLAGRDVVCDDTNLEAKTVRQLHILALTHGAELKTWDLCHVPLDECLRRDRLRIAAGERGVGETIIRSMAQRAKLPPEGGVAPAWNPDTDVERIVPYVANERWPRVIICDIDGTVALHAERSPYDYTRVHTDAPNYPVIRALAALANIRSGPFGTNVTQLIFLSGRPDSCRAETEKWLKTHVGRYDELYMRAAGDTRNDAVIKMELFDKHVRDRFNVVGVFDDRDRVVRLWRALGLPTFQVADGDF